MTGNSRPQFLKTMMAASNMPEINIDPVNLASIDGVYAEVPEELLKKLDESAVVSFNGKKALVPAQTSLRAQAFYNKEFFAQAGIEGLPTTLEGFKETCQKLQDAGIVPLITSGEGYLGHPRRRRGGRFHPVRPSDPDSRRVRLFRRSVRQYAVSWN